MFGPVLGLLGLPAVALSWRRGARGTVLASAAVVYILLVASLLRWQIWHGRILITLAALVAPLLAPLFVGRSRAAVLWISAVALACVSCQVVCSAYNERKPLMGPYAIWGKDRLQLMGIGIPREESILRLLEALSPPASHVAVAPKDPGEARYPLFGPRLERRVRMLRFDREDLPVPRGLPGTEALLLSGEAESVYLDTEPTGPGHRWWAAIDLRPQLEKLRRPGSGWRAVVDADSGGHLFVRDAGARVTLSPDLPIHFPLNDAWWPDNWVGPVLQLLVRFDPALPLLEIAGEMPDSDVPPVLEVAHPAAPALKRFELGPGSFRVRVPLARLARERPAEYLAVEIRCNLTFNPRRMGHSPDTRDLSWRMGGLRTVPRQGGG